MKLAEIMTRDVQVIAPDATVAEAAQLMKEQDVGGLPVCDGDRLTGFVTDRDITIGAVAANKNPSECNVADVMCDDVYWCYEDQDVHEAGKLMRDKQIRRLMVLDRNKRLVGIASLGDLAVGAGDDTFAGNVLESVSEPAHH